MPKGIPKSGRGRRDHVLPGERTRRVEVVLPVEALTRFKLMYPRGHALRLLMNAALRAAIERPDLCPWLKAAYGPRQAWHARFRDNTKLEHPMRDIRAADFVLEPEPLPPRDAHGIGPR